MNLNYWLRAIRLHGIGPRKFLRLYQAFSTIAELFSATREEWREKKLPDKYWEIIQACNQADIERDIVWLQQAHHHIISLEDDDYPLLLKEIIDPPLVLYVKGNKLALHQLQLAIVGARAATAQGIKLAERFAKELAEAGVAVTSGLALGIDGASHRGALSGNGMTIGVTGAGLHHVYPPKHQSLYEKIIEHHGAIISEFPLQVPAHPMNFPRRNRIIAGLSKGVLVIEAAIKSGSLITARLALESGREVFAIPGSINQPLSRGCHHLIRQGAVLVEKVADILEEFKIKIKTDAEQFRVDLTPNEQQMLNYIKYEITPIDMILLHSRLTAGELSSILLTLELKGKIESVPGGYVRT